MDTAPYRPEQFSPHTFGVNDLYPSGFQGHHSTRDTRKSNQLQEPKNPACCLLWKIPLTFMGSGCDKWQMCWTPPKAPYNVTAETFRPLLFCSLSKYFTTTTKLNELVNNIPSNQWPLPTNILLQQVFRRHNCSVWIREVCLQCV